MGYYEFKIKIPDESKDAVINGLSDIGCLGMIENNSHITAYFPDVIGIDTIKNGLSSLKIILKNAGLDNEITVDHVFISERDWNESWKKKFKPIDVGETFSILPPWEEKNSSRINLIIDPGMAFGTGHHETTKTCLLLIERLSKKLIPTIPPLVKGGEGGLSFLDVGTGTGILAIAASILGYEKVAGVDIDPLAVDAAQRNVILNNLQNIEIKEGSISAALGAYDFIAANLMSEILIKIAPEMPLRLNRSGIALLSGMIAGQEDDVIAAMENEGLEFVEKFVDGRWVSVVLRH